MPSCCVIGCGARKNINQPQLTLHIFPRNEVMRRKWLEIIGTENINARHKNWYVCSLHFDETCFNRTLTVARLRDYAVPSSSLMPFQRTITTQPTEPIDKSQPSRSDETLQVPDKARIHVLREKQNIEDICSVQAPDHMSNINAPSVKAVALAHQDGKLQMNLDRAHEMNRQLNEEIKELKEKCKVKQRKIKSLFEKVRRRDKKIALISNIIKDLQDQNLIRNQETLILEECAGPEDFLKRQIAKAKGLPLDKKYSEEIFSNLF